MTKRRFLFWLTAVVLAAFAPHALGHSTVKRTVPPSGSVLGSSPDEVVIEFNEAARMTSVAVVAAGKADRKLAFEPSGSAKSFVVRRPDLSAGRNEIQWKALSRDGHPIGGTIIVVIKPGAEAKAPSPGHGSR